MGWIAIYLAIAHQWGRRNMREYDDNHRHSRSYPDERFRAYLSGLFWPPAVIIHVVFAN